MQKEARSFSTTKAYSIGDLVIYEGKLYRFTQNHSAGAWNESQVAAVDNDQAQLLNRILAGAENADKASAYADTVVFEASQIAGTRYKYTFTNAADPRE